jgi:hypothetical protein
MERKLKTLKGRINWFLNFANSRIEGLSHREMFGLWTELRDIAFGEIGRHAIRDRSLVNWPEKREQAIKSQKLIRDCLGRVLTVAKQPKKHMITPIFSESEFPDPDEEDLGRMGTALEDIILSETQSRPISKWAGDYVAYALEAEMKVLADGEKVLVAIGKPEVKLLLEFLSSLSQISLNLLQTCQREDCSNYFYKATKKEKRYCSNRCAWIVASRERRKTQPDREKERKKESYKKGKVRETGHKNLKIQKKGE